MAKGNGGLKVLATGMTAVAILLGGALLTAYAGAASHISRTDAQAMVDRGDNTIKERLDRIDVKLGQIDAKLDQLTTGQSP